MMNIMDEIEEKRMLLEALYVRSRIYKRADKALLKISMEMDELINRYYSEGLSKINIYAIHCTKKYIENKKPKSGCYTSTGNMDSFAFYGTVITGYNGNGIPIQKTIKARTPIEFWKLHYLYRNNLLVHDENPNSKIVDIESNDNPVILNNSVNLFVKPNSKTGNSKRRSV